MRGADVLLADGSTVHVRPIRPEDAAAIVAMHARFSERTRYLRYFSPYQHIPERDLRRFVNVDHRDREALVVAAGGQLIAIGRYERLGPDAAEAEVAFVVEDAHQGHGVGSMLLEHLASAAQQAGIRRFVAEVLPANNGMLRVFADAGYQIQREYADGVVHLSFPIASTEASLAVQHRREQSTEARSIARLLAPGAVAVYGAHRDGTGVGAALLRHLTSFTGPVYPVRLGQSLADLPGPVDLAVVAVPAPGVSGVVRDAARHGAAGVVVVSDGFAETGPAGARAQQELLQVARAAGLRLVGPNCLGIANTDPAVQLNATLSATLPPPGRVGFFCQSGALGVALLAEAERRGLGLSSFVSAGNRADVSGNDLLQYWQDDPGTDVVLLYLETFGNPRKFARLARRLGRDKPIVALASPYRPAGMVGGPDPSGAAALFARSGLIRVADVAELFDVGVLLAGQPLPGGNRVGIVTNSAALGVLAAGACLAAGLTVTVQSDLGGQTGPELFADTLAAAAADPESDALVVVYVPPPQVTPDGDVTAAIAAAATGDKPVVATLLAGPVPAGVPVYPSVEEAVRALGRVAEYAQWRRAPAGRVPELSEVDVAAAQAAVRAQAPVEDLLRGYGVRVVPSRLATGAGSAAAMAAELGYPVALKVTDPALLHRPDLGAVRLDLVDERALLAGYAELARLFGRDVENRDVENRGVEGRDVEVIVQPMVPPGVSMVIEAIEDPSFGPVVGFGPGGVTGELVGDRAWRAAPLTDRDAFALIREPKAAPLLLGHRGVAPVDLNALADLLLRVGRLVDEHAEVRALALNPVLARPSGASVLAATVQYGQPMDRPDAGPRWLV